MSSDLLEPWVKPCGFLAREQPDLAVLDVNLHGHPVVAVAKRLRSLQIPLILALAYERFDFDDSEVLATAENVGKSFTPPQVLAASGRRISSCIPIQAPKLKPATQQCLLLGFIACR